MFVCSMLLLTKELHVPMSEGRDQLRNIHVIVTDKTSLAQTFVCDIASLNRTIVISCSVLWMLDRQTTWIGVRGLAQVCSDCDFVKNASNVVAEAIGPIETWRHRTAESQTHHRRCMVTSS